MSTFTPMSTETPTADESAVTTADSTANPVETFLSTVTDALAECGASDDTLAAVKTAGDAVVDHVEQLHDDLEETRDELESVRDRAGRDRAELAGRVSQLEDAVDDDHADGGGDDAAEPDSPDARGGGSTAETTLPDAETPLEETLRLPDAVAEDSLSANQQRARSVARDIGDYAEFNHEYGNYSLTAKRLRIVLKAQSEGDAAAHHQTVKRVRDFLDRLGESEVTVTEDRGGTKRLVFAESLVGRVEAYTDAEAHGGVRHDTVGRGVET